MKICWDNLESLYWPKGKPSYLKSTKTKSNYYILDKCKVCQNPFVSTSKKSTTCSKECQNIYISWKFKGKKFSEEHKKNISKSAKGRPSSFKGKKHTEEQKRKWSELRSNGMYKGKNNPRYGDHRTWNELHGKDKANELKKINSIKWKGKNNVNSNGNHWVNKENGREKQLVAIEKGLQTKLEKYGCYSHNQGKSYEEIYGKEKSKEIKSKISNTLKDYFYENGTNKNNISIGLSGWYKKIYFRSGMELSFLLWAENNNLTIESAENSKFVVKYFYKGEWSNYFPDFYIKENGNIIEIKPKNMKKIEKIQSKTKYAKNKYKDKYIIVDEERLKELNAPLINKEILEEMYYNNLVTLSKFTYNKIIGE